MKNEVYEVVEINDWEGETVFDSNIFANKNDAIKNYNDRIKWCRQDFSEQEDIIEEEDREEEDKFEYTYVCYKEHEYSFGHTTITLCLKEVI